MSDIAHLSSCAVHNMPAYPAGPCDCGAINMTALARELAEALRPFASYDPQNLSATCRDDAPVTGFVLADVRRAKDAFAKARAAGLLGEAADGK